MNTIKDGGPAFPIPILPGELWNHELYGNPNGMTLRDWFAGMALQGLMVRYDEHPNVVKVCAEIAYDAADAMIASRERKEEK